MDTNIYLNQVEKRVQRYFDIEKDKNLWNLDFNIFARFNQRNERYVLSKKAVIYAFENNEYILCKVTDGVDNKLIDNIKDIFKNNLQDIIDTRGDHMASTVTFLLVGKDDLEPEIEKLIAKTRLYKSFSLGLKGWCNGRLLYINLNNGEIVSNNLGREVRDNFAFR